MKDLLIEIGTEELPARIIENVKEAFRTLIEEALASRGVQFGHSSSYATPRRISVLVNSVSVRQKETITLKYGPPVKIAYDSSGNPLEAAFGFARSQGVDLKDLLIVEKNGVKVIACEKREGGKNTEDILPEIIRDAVEKIPLPKKMRWGYETFGFARPIRWLLVLFGESVIELKIADVQSGNLSYGHRFLCPNPVQILRPSEYFSKLKEAYVIVDERERRNLIVEGIRKIEEETGSKALYDEPLLNEILYMTEYPYPMKGKFDPSYLSLPPSVLVNVMKSHQKYIPLISQDGTLSPYFIFFANILPRDEGIIVKGNEKVLKARLDDAKFYFEEDKRQDLFSLYEKLSNVIYHEKIGSMKEKVERIEGIARFLKSHFNLADIPNLERTSKLLKVDLLTRMVSEFPELQGKMGKIYAELKGEEGDLCMAIEEHYYPLSSEGKLPNTWLGTIMGIADKIDTLVSFFSLGITPKGNFDPYGLRRCAIGLIRILVEKGLFLPLDELISCAYREGEKISNRMPLERVKEDLIDFIATRFKFLMIERGFDQDLVESVMAFASVDLYDGYLRLESLHRMRQIPEFERLLIGFKRVFNITKKFENEDNVKSELFEKKEEEELFKTYELKKGPYLYLIREKRYAEALSLLIDFKDPIDAFFDNVFVMVEDKTIRENRLALLKKIRDTFLSFCDFQKIKSE